MQTSENQTDDLQILLNEHHEWLLIDASGRSFALQKSEIEINFERGRTLFGFLDDKGFQTWRVAEYKTKSHEIHLVLTRNFDRERAKIRLVPRALARQLSDSVELARLERANKIAALIKETYPQLKVARVSLNKENGRFAQIIVEDLRGRQTAVLCDVSDSLTPEILLSSAILWLVKLQNRRRNAVETIWLVAEKTQAKKLQKLHALLKENWKSAIRFKEISCKNAESQSEVIVDLTALEITDLWRGGKTRETKPPALAAPTETAREIVEIAPDEIDVVYSKHGETLRFNGLPFARLRRVLDEERLWFGIEKSRQILTTDSAAEFDELFENLRKFRRHDSPNKRHALYQTAPEAWLEAALRRNIKLLDANLILSPLYHQFRAGRDRVDLLALRRDGRLVIIEVKTAPDREMVFQLADYWRKIERQRRAGNLERAHLFGDARIADAPTICYAVAPTLSFHREFDFLAAALAPEIEIHRFNLAENWRENLKVLDRKTRR